jgi:hypothetical protein
LLVIASEAKQSIFLQRRYGLLCFASLAMTIGYNGNSGLRFALRRAGVVEPDKVPAHRGHPSASPRLGDRL